MQNVLKGTTEEGGFGNGCSPFCGRQEHRPSGRTLETNTLREAQGPGRSSHGGGGQGASGSLMAARQRGAGHNPARTAAPRSGLGCGLAPGSRPPPAWSCAKAAPPQSIRNALLEMAPPGTAWKQRNSAPPTSASASDNRETGPAPPRKSTLRGTDPVTKALPGEYSPAGLPSREGFRTCFREKGAFSTKASSFKQDAGRPCSALKSRARESSPAGCYFRGSSPGPRVRGPRRHGWKGRSHKGAHPPPR